MLWLIAVFIAVIAVSLVFGQKTLTGSGTRRDREPAVRRRRRQPSQPGPGDRDHVPWHLRGLGRLAGPPFPQVDGRGTPADQVGRVRVRGRSRRHRRFQLFERDLGAGGVHRWRGLPLVPALDRHRDPSVPPLRPGRRGPEGGRLCGARPLRHRRLPRARRRPRRVVRTRRLVPHDGRGRDRGRDVPAGARAC